MMGFCLSSCRSRSTIETTSSRSTIETTETTGTTISENPWSRVRISGTVWKLPERRTLTHLYRDCSHFSNSHSEPSSSKICDDCIKRAKKQA